MDSWSGHACPLITTTDRNVRPTHRYVISPHVPETEQDTPWPNINRD